MFRRLTALAAAILLLAAFMSGSTAEVTEEKKETGGKVTAVTWKDENGNPIAPPNGKPPMGFPGGKGPHGPRPKRPGETAEEEKPQA